MGNTRKADFILLIDIPAQPEKKLYALLSNTIKLLEYKRPFPSGRIHWALTSCIFSDLSSKAGSSIRDLLKQRIISCHDSIVPKGFSGASHSLLLRNELEKEINWGLSNSWSTGVKDLFDIYPDAWIPADIDLYRSMSRFLYDSYPYIWIILPNEKSDATTIQCIYRNDLLEFPFLRLHEQDKASLYKKIKRDEGKWPQPLFCHFLLAGDESLSILEQFFAVGEKLYSSRWTISFDCLDTHLLKRQEKEIRAVEGEVNKEVLLHSPIHRMVRMNGYEKHILIKKNVEEKKVAAFLQEFGKSCSIQQPDIPDNSPVPFKPAERSLFANMPGFTTISEQNQVVEFENGRLKALYFLQTPVICGLPVESFICSQEKRWYFQSTTPFSFEDESSRGLRETLILETAAKDTEPLEGGFLIVDYYFQEGMQELAVSVHVRYPDFPKRCSITAFAPLEIPLFFIDRSESVSFQGYYPDGESYSADIPGKEAVYEFPGSLYCFSLGNRHLTVNFACVPHAPITLLPTKITRNKRQYLLSINPMGSYRPNSSDNVGGFEEFFTFLLKGTEGAVPPVDISLFSGKEIGDPPWIGKTKKS